MKRIFTIIFAAAALTGCIEPLVLTPDIKGEITAIEVEGQTRTPSINPSTRTVSIELGQSANISALKITKFEITETASCDIAQGDVIALLSPLAVKIKTAAEYEWTIVATREQEELPGSSFDLWHRSDRNGNATPDGKVWNPWAEGEEPGISAWWDTGNVGTTFLGNSNSTPTEPGEGCPANPSGRAARLESLVFLGIPAGGNIFFGRFAGLAGTNAKCEMGYPWSKKPRALKGWFKYTPQMINSVRNQYYLNELPEDLKKLTIAEWKTRMDEMSVTIALWAAPDGAGGPFTVNTSLSAFYDLTRDKEGMIAWGQLSSSEVQSDWKEFSLDLEYLKPEYQDENTPLPAGTRLIVTVSASKYANYFIAGTSGGEGGGGSLMYVDELELVY